MKRGLVWFISLILLIGGAASFAMDDDIGLGVRALCLNSAFSGRELAS